MLEIFKVYPAGLLLHELKSSWDIITSTSNVIAIIPIVSKFIGMPVTVVVALLIADVLATVADDDVVVDDAIVDDAMVDEVVNTFSPPT